MTTRREFFTFLGGAGATAAVPAMLSGCLELPAPQPGGGANDAWERRAQQLEDSNGVYTAGNEGMWAGKAGTHVPQIEFDTAAGTARIFNTHPMTEGHWITTIYVRDQGGAVIHLVEFVVRGASAATEATTTFTVPAGTTQITAYAYCNLHDAWSSAEQSIGP